MLASVSRHRAGVRATVPAVQEEEEGLFKADAVNEEDPERDRATRRRKCGPPYYDPKGDSPLSLHATERAKCLTMSPSTACCSKTKIPKTSI